AGDRIRDRLAKLRSRELGLRLGALRVLDRVDERDLVSAGDRPELVEGGDRRARDVREAVLELIDADADLRGHLLVGRRPRELRLELAHRALDLPRPGPNRTRHPVERAELVEDRAPDSRDRIRLELDVAVRVVALDRLDQAEQPVRDEVAFVDVSGEAAP